MSLLSKFPTVLLLFQGAASGCSEIAVTQRLNGARGKLSSRGGGLEIKQGNSETKRCVIVFSLHPEEAPHNRGRNVENSFDINMVPIRKMYSRVFTVK